ncbi:MAG: bile acid:sodium symporter family protein [Myxococcota bacterium]
MEESVLTKVVLPLALFIIMWGLGLSLTPAEFKRGLKRPGPVVVGAFGQLVLLPALGFAVAFATGLQGELAVGLVILALCPGGVTSNLLSFLAKGDLALSITLTAISSVLTPFTVPLLANVAFSQFGLDPQEVALPVGKTMLTLVAITILPVALGMLIRNKRPKLAGAAERPIRIFSALFLALIIAGVAKQNWNEIPGYFAQTGVAALLLNVAAMGAGWGLATLLRFGVRPSTTIGLEVGIQNGTTAIFITVTLLEAPTMSVAPAVYSLIMFATGAAFAIWRARLADREPPAPEEARSF